MKNKTVCILLADGFEEVEALYPADIFTRLGINVILTGIEAMAVRGAHNIKVFTHATLNEISPADFDALMLPGGLPGATNLRDNTAVLELIRRADKHGKIIAAICAAPIVLHEAGIITTSTCTTGYPDTEKLAHNPNFKFTGNMVETDGHIITAIGMGQAAPFAYAIAKALGIPQTQIDELTRSAFISDL